MQLIAETLLWMSRESPEPLPEEDIDLSELVGELIQKHRYLIGNRDIELIIDIHNEPCRLPPPHAASLSATSCATPCNTLKRATWKSVSNTLNYA